MLYEVITQQGTPMGLAGDPGEGSRYQQDVCPGRAQLAVQFGKAHIIADGEPQPTKGRGHHAIIPPRQEAVRFPVTAMGIGHVNIEQMQLVVVATQHALIVIDQRGGMHLGLPGHPGGQASRHQPDAVLARPGRQLTLDGAMPSYNFV